MGQTCDFCWRDADTMIPMSVDTGETIRDEDWCPACCAELVTDEAFAADRSE